MPANAITEPIRKGWRQELPWLNPKFSSKKGAGSNHTLFKTLYVLKAISRKHKQPSLIKSVQTYDAGTGKSADLYGFIDILWNHDRAVQACGTDWNPHLDKLRYECEYSVIDFLKDHPHRSLELWGWYPPTKTRCDWWPRIQLVTLPFLAGQEPPTYLSFGAILDGATGRDAVMNDDEAA